MYFNFRGGNCKDGMWVANKKEQNLTKEISMPLKPSKKFFARSIAVRLAFLCLAAILFGNTGAALGKQRIDISYLYSLSNFSGTLPFMRAKLFVDPYTNETYVLDPASGTVSIFNSTGMEIFRFGDDGSLGTILSLAVEQNGNMLVLSQMNGKTRILRCNYRGEPLAKLPLDTLPAHLKRFSADRMAYRDGRIYLLDKQSFQVVQLDADGTFRHAYDLVTTLQLNPKKLESIDIGGFNVDGDGNLLFTVPTLFCAYILSPDGKIDSFGESGGAPGKFGIVGDILSDTAGNFYVADRLRNVVLIFDKDRQFQGEFGYFGPRPENLVGPQHIALDAQGRLYVSQLRDRGVSVFEINYR